MKKMLFALAAVLAASAFAVFAGCAARSADPAPSEADSPPVAAKRSYTVAHITGKPRWDGTEKLDIDVQPWLEPVAVKAHAQLCYSDSALFVHMWAEEKDIRAEHQRSDRLANVYEDSCLEFFIAPVPDDARYLNFEFNPNGCMCAEIGTAKTDRIRLVVPDGVLNVASARTASGWEISYEIPFGFIRELYPAFSAEAGKRVAGNFYKCGNLTARKHYIAWNPVGGDKPNFHRPQDFGILVFEK